MLNKQKGQSTLEYALIIAVVVAGLFAMQIYMKRGIEGKLRTSSDDIGAQFEAGRSTVYTASNHTGVTVERTATGVTTSRSDGSDGSVRDTFNTSGNETVSNF
ncbi:MAG: hypothetical protein V1670_03180 [Candidatus Omnitrophota bacterium]